ncbi:1053_t:CDS:10, partial [Cetraspora pellucida]
EAKYGVISQFPIMDSPRDPLESYKLTSERSFEHFEVGYSKFGLKRYNITVELAASKRTGLHRYTFPRTKHKAKIVIDLPHNLIVPNYAYTHRYLGGAIQSISLNQVKGAARYRGGWNQGGPYVVYFCSQFNVKAIEFETWADHNFNFRNQIYFDGTTHFGKIDGAILTFNVTENPVIISRVGISFISADQACNNAESEIPYWDFEKTKQEAVNAWQKELEKIFVEGGTDELKTIFYSGLYRTMIMPSDRTGENPKWQSFDKNGNLIPHYGDFYTLWDTFRTTNPLFMLFQQERSVDIVRSLIDIYQNEGYMPDGRSGLENGITQGGSNGDMVVVETYLKKLGIDIIDWELAYEALIKDAEVDPLDRGIYEGRRTIEYSANDYSISLIAKDKYDDYIKYRKRARNWENLWNPNITFNGAKGFIMPRYQDGKYHNKLDIDGSHFAFYEATSWEYSLNIPFDILKTKFGSGQDGIPGNDDSGAMGSWFAFNAIGLYPLAGTDIYLINSPHFNRVTINLSPRITFTIMAHNLTNGSHVNPYVQSVKINGKNWRKTWFRHSNIANGAIMELFMGPGPSKVWGVIGGNEDKIDVEYRVVPPSMM